ncbi:hypothetical protein CRM22_011159 [Opisthorchis felineus]|uniref:Uncharacterized protein n=1 Tax=Opisthorchis felineus TaxID=147828 RepID=A0A4S2KDN1_OPIFE|nr:hypothetical protein CRM22_011159 [Opisthorchis felineus]
MVAFAFASVFIFLKSDEILWRLSEGSCVNPPKSLSEGVNVESINRFNECTSLFEKFMELKFHLVNFIILQLLTAECSGLNKIPESTIQNTSELRGPNYLQLTVTQLSRFHR